MGEELTPPKIAGGFFVVGRILLEKSLWQLSPEHTRLAIYLLSKARAKDDPVNLPGGDVIRRGEMVCSLAQIAESCAWYENRSNREWSRKKVSRLLEELENIGFIKANSHRKGTHITICNYAEYQTIDNYKSHKVETQREHRGNTGAHQQEVEEVQKGETVKVPPNPPRGAEVLAEIERQLEKCSPRRRILITAWLQYKKDNKDFYKSPIGIKTLFSKINKEAINDDHLSFAIEEATSSNWKGMRLEDCSHRFINKGV